MFVFLLLSEDCEGSHGKLPRGPGRPHRMPLQWWSALTHTGPQSCLYKLYLLFSLCESIIFEITSIIAKERVVISVEKKQGNY